jgi:hypothetical protein
MQHIVYNTYIINSTGQESIIPIPINSISTTNIPIKSILNVPINSTPSINVPTKNIPIKNIPINNIPINNSRNIPISTTNVPTKNIPINNIPLKGSSSVKINYTPLRASVSRYLNQKIHDIINVIPLNYCSLVFELTIEEIYSLMTNNLVIMPGFQRGEVWTLELKMSLIDSIYQQYSPPNLVLRNNNGKLECLDGQQRIKTIKNYLDNKITHTYGGALFLQLEPNIKEYFKSQTLSVRIFYNMTDKQSMDYFIRLQKGKPLETCEMIAARYNSYLLKYFKQLTIDTNVNCLVHGGNNTSKQSLYFLSALYGYLDSKNILVMKEEDFGDYLETFIDDILVSKEILNEMKYAIQMMIMKNVGKVSIAKFVAIAYYIIWCNRNHQNIDCEKIKKIKTGKNKAGLFDVNNLIML